MFPSSGNWQADMKYFLDEIQPPGNFCVGKKIQDTLTFLPRINVKGMEDDRLSLPVPKSQIRELVALAERAPFGKGLDTVLDESVRKAWQIDATNISFDEGDVNKPWKKALKVVTQFCVESLCSANLLQHSQVDANLYKMLVYDTGGHFQKHVDAEKEPGMFATMVIQLPSKHDGGQLNVYHGKESRTFDFSNRSDDSFFVSSFFADCEHELLPVTAGYRVCLVYNLVMSTSQIGNVALPSANAADSEIRLMRRMARQLESDKKLSHVQGYFLEHKYTQTNLNFRNLKGRDKSVADTLRGVQDENGNPLYVVSLMLMQYSVSGSQDYYGGGMGDVYDEGYDSKIWIGPDDKPLGDFRLAFDFENQVLRDLGDDHDIMEMFDEEQPDEEEVEGYTGNAGPTVDYVYYKSLVVFWPKSAQYEIAGKAGSSFLVSSMLAAKEVIEIREFGNILIQNIESKSVGTGERIFQALEHLGDESIVLRALNCTNTIEGIGPSLLSLIDHSDSESVSSAVLDVIRRSSEAACARTVQYRSSRSSCVKDLVELYVHFERKCPPDFVVKVRNAVLYGVLMDVDNFATNKFDVITLIPLLIQDADVFSKLTDVLVKHPAGLKSILDPLLEKMTDRAAKNESVVRLAKARFLYLVDRVEKGEPQFSVRQTDANFSGSRTAEVNAFLRGPEVSKTFRGFNGISHARNWSSKYFNSYYHDTNYSARAVPGGRGKDAFVTLQKTNASYKAALLQYQTDKKEWKNIVKVFSFPVEDDTTTIANDSGTKRPMEGDDSESQRQSKKSAGREEESGGSNRELDRPRPLGVKTNPIVL
mmetsp:Transcript_44251/g.107009  ORF Transcript_44251/g.107009 Transcript_44251/m.107009 type:complete len:817 (+) Transcript_44251:2878-5328(+)